MITRSAKRVKLNITQQLKLSDWRVCAIDSVEISSFPSVDITVTNLPVNTFGAFFIFPLISESDLYR